MQFELRYAVQDCRGTREFFSPTRAQRGQEIGLGRLPWGGPLASTDQVRGPYLGGGVCAGCTLVRSSRRQRVRPLFWWVVGVGAELEVSLRPEGFGRASPRQLRQKRRSWLIKALAWRCG
jgi:hypothetical protein